MTARIARHVHVHGQVQGVFFRATARRRAESLGVVGFARNCPDGSVEIWAEGSPSAVESLIEFCRRGPRGAVVERVDVEDVAPSGERDFVVR
jgi:acylphosphatase